jgi:hypothetical protein
MIVIACNHVNQDKSLKHINYKYNKKYQILQINLPLIKILNHKTKSFFEKYSIYSYETFLS